MPIDARLRKKIKVLMCIKDRSVRQLVKSVFLLESGYINTIEVDGLNDAHEKLVAHLSDPQHQPLISLIDNQETWKKTFAFIDKIRTTEVTKEAEFILLADADNDPVIEAEVQQRALGQLLPKPFSRASFHAAFDNITQKLAIPTHNASIMLVDDDREFCNMLQRDYFGPAGFKSVTCCYSYEEALRLLNAMHGRADQVDLIISDLKMPGHTGLDLLKRVRGDHRWEGMPFLMLSGAADKSAVVEALKCKVTEFVIKPVPPKALLEKISKYMPWFTGPKAS